MSIEVAKTAGFCFGVNRAVQMVYDLIEAGESICTLGPIIHNPQLVEELAEKGVERHCFPGGGSRTQGGDPFPWRSPAASMMRSLPWGFPVWMPPVRLWQRSIRS